MSAPAGINPIDTQGYWMVGSDHLYIPSYKMKVEHTNLAGSESGRTEDGSMKIDWIRRDIRKIHLHWSVMTQDELNYVMGLMQGEEYVLTFRDQGVTQTANCYTGEAKYTYEHSIEGGGALYTDVEINAIEM